MDLDLPALGRSALVGLATGARSFSGLAAQVVQTPPLSTRQPEATLARPWVKGLVVLAAAGELVGDKLPSAPSRLVPYVLASRLVLAAGTAVLVVRAEDEEARDRRAPAAWEQGPAEASLPPQRAAAAVPGTVALAVPVAVAASLVSATAGHAWRRRAARLFRADWPGAVLEDLLTVVLAVRATRR
jgi:uncharacterized membrane protein